MFLAIDEPVIGHLHAIAVFIDPDFTDAAHEALDMIPPISDWIANLVIVNETITASASWTGSATIVVSGAEIASVVLIVTLFSQLVGTFYALETLWMMWQIANGVEVGVGGQALVTHCARHA